MLIADFLPIQTGGVLAGSAEYFNKWAWYWQGISIIEDVSLQYLTFFERPLIAYI